MIKPKALTSLSVILPCFNEAAALPAVLQEAHLLEGYGAEYEVLVVDDGSADETAAVTGCFAEKNPRIRLLRHERNQGYGAAVRTGLAAASKDLICLMDADGQFRLGDLDKLFSKIDSCDVVTGYRLARRDWAGRRLLGKTGVFLLRVLLGLKVHDPDCGFKLYKRSALQGLTLRSNQLFIHAEMLAQFRRKGVRVEEIAVTHYPRERGNPSAVSPSRVLATMGEAASFLLGQRSKKDKGKREKGK